MNQAELCRRIEALLLMHTQPQPLGHIAELLGGDVSKPVIREALATLHETYLGRGIELLETAQGFCFQIASDLTDWLQEACAQKPQKFSSATLETLALIAYKGPITRGEIEAVRGVAVSTSTIRALQEQGWIRVTGRKQDVPGRPELLGTTQQFLSDFNLDSLTSLPALPET